MSRDVDRPGGNPRVGRSGPVPAIEHGLAGKAVPCPGIRGRATRWSCSPSARMIRATSGLSTTPCLPVDPSERPTVSSRTDIHGWCKRACCHASSRRICARSVPQNREQGREAHIGTTRAISGMSVRAQGRGIDPLTARCQCLDQRQWQRRSSAYTVCRLGAECVNQLLQWLKKFSVPSGRTLKWSNECSVYFEPSEPLSARLKVKVPLLTTSPFWLKPPQTA